MNNKKTKKFFMNENSKVAPVVFLILCVGHLATINSYSPPIQKILGVCWGIAFVISVIRGIRGSWGAPKPKQLDRICEAQCGDLVKKAADKFGISETEAKSMKPYVVQGYSGYGWTDAKCDKKWQWRTNIYEGSVLLFGEEKLYIYVHKLDLLKEKQGEEAVTYPYENVSRFSLSTPANPNNDRAIREMKVLRIHMYFGDPLSINDNVIDLAFRHLAGDKAKAAAEKEIGDLNSELQGRRGIE